MRAILAAVIGAPLLAAALPPPRPLPTEVKVGCYYFPGHFNAARWSPMVAHGGPTPLLGRYRDGAPGVSDWHIRWAVEHGISYFVFDWYCNYRVGPSLQHNTALDEGFLKAQYRDLMEFALMWSNEEDAKSPLYTVEDMLRTARHMGRYFREANYLRIDGRPVMVVSRAARIAKSFGPGFRDLIPRLSREAGLPPGTDIFFVALARQPDPMLQEMGFAATTAYNYAGHRARKHGSPLRATYDDMVEGYEQVWQRMTAPGCLPYIVPVSPGWDSRPWYGAQAFVRTGSTPEKFADMCRRARRHVDPRLNMVLAECWNEFGEGSYIEPCEETGFGHLRAMRETFAPHAETHSESAVPDGNEKVAFTFRAIPPQRTDGALGRQEGNLVPDPGMEEGTGWTTYTGAPCKFLGGDTHAGRQSLLVKRGHGCKTQNPMPVSKGRAYRVSAWVKCAPGGSLLARLAWFDKRNRWTKQYDQVETCRSPDWTRVSKEIVVMDPEVGAVSFEFVASGANAQVDDVAMVNTREAKPPQVVLDADCTTGDDWLTFAGGTPACGTSPDGAGHVLLAARQGMKTRRSVPVKPGEVLGFRVRMQCDPLASVSIRSAGFDADGRWIEGTYFGGEIYSWQDWREIVGVVRIPQDTAARSINLECTATGGAVRVSQARIERDAVE